MDDFSGWLFYILALFFLFFFLMYTVYKYISPAYSVTNWPWKIKKGINTYIFWIPAQKQNWKTAITVVNHSI